MFSTSSKNTFPSSGVHKVGPYLSLGGNLSGDTEFSGNAGAHPVYLGGYYEPSKALDMFTAFSENGNVFNVDDGVDNNTIEMYADGNYNYWTKGQFNAELNLAMNSGQPEFQVKTRNDGTSAQSRVFSNSYQTFLSSEQNLSGTTYSGRIGSSSFGGSPSVGMNIERFGAVSRNASMGLSSNDSLAPELALDNFTPYVSHDDASASGLTEIRTTLRMKRNPGSTVVSSGGGARMDVMTFVNQSVPTPVIMSAMDIVFDNTASGTTYESHYDFYVAESGGLSKIVDITKNGLHYNTDYSANYTTRSLVDKEYVDSIIGGGTLTNKFWKTSGTTVLTNTPTIITSAYTPTFLGNANNGIKIQSTTDNPTLFFNSANSGNFRNWKIAGDGDETYRGLTIYRSTGAGLSATTATAKFTDNGSLVVGSDFSTSHMIYWQPKNALRIGQGGGGDYAIQNYDFIQGNNIQNQSSGTDNLLKGQAYSLAGASKGNIISGEAYLQLSGISYNLLLEGGASNDFRRIAGSILIGANNQFNNAGITDFGQSSLYNLQVGNHNSASKTHHLFQWGTGLRNHYGLTAWSNWTYQPKFIFGTANVQLTGATSRASFVIANGLLNNGSHSDPSTYHSHSLTHLNNGWTQINTRNNGFLSGGVELTENDVIPKAALEVVSTNSGILVPRLTNSQFTGMTSGNKVNGLILYESTNDKFKFYQNGGFVELSGGGGSITANNGLTNNGNNVRLGGTLTGDTEILGNAGTTGMFFDQMSEFYASSSDNTGDQSEIRSVIGYVELFSQAVSADTTGRLKVTPTGITIAIENDIPQSLSYLLIESGITRISSFNSSGTTGGLIEFDVEHIDIQSTGDENRQLNIDLYSNIGDFQYQSAIHFSNTGSTTNVIDMFVGSTEAGNRSVHLLMNKHRMIVESQFSGFTGVEYAGNYSANFGSRSLVDKAYVDSVVGTGSTAINIQSISSNTTISSTTDVVLVDSSGGVVIVTLPVSPNPNKKIIIKDRTGNALTNNISIDGNGRNIDGDTLTAINTDRGAIELVYSVDFDEYYIVGFVN